MEQENEALLPENIQEETTATPVAVDAQPIIDAETNQPESIEEDALEIETDEHEETDAYEKVAREMADFESMSVPQLIAEAKKMVADNEVQAIRTEMDAIKHAALHQLDEVRNEKLQEFLAEGGFEIDFEYDQPLRRDILGLYNDYRKLRNTYYKDLEAQLFKNLAAKKDIIDAIKLLPQKEGSIAEIHKELHELQDRWRIIGHVPKTESDELWKNYHFHLDNYYKFLSISNELRDLDFKKNLDAKVALCEEAEALAALEDTNTAFKGLQNLHKRWKVVGPVDRTNREPIWDRFKEASDKIHEKRTAYFEAMQAQWQERLQKKHALIEQLKALDTTTLTTHNAWQTAMKETQVLRDAYREIGRVNLPENDVAWKAFNEAATVFSKAKNEFYRTLKKNYNDNLAKKQTLLDQVHAIKDSEDWKETANTLKRIQNDWKNIGYVPRAEGDKIWKAFREACNHFFNRLTAFNKERDKALYENLETKKALLEEVKAWQPNPENSGKSANEIKGFIAQWRALGAVPREERGLETEFNTLIDGFFGALKMNQRESNMLRFENKLHGLKTDDSRQLGREEEFLSKKIDEAKKDLQQLENNILFFAHVDENNPIVRDVRKKIDKQREVIEELKDKIKMVRTTLKQ